MGEWPSLRDTLAEAAAGSDVAQDDHRTAIAEHAGFPNIHHTESHTVASHGDTTATGSELDTLTDGSETALHSHASSGGDLMHVEENLSGTVTVTSAKAVVLNHELTLSAGNVYKIEFMFSFINDTGTSRVYTTYLDIGSVFSASVNKTMGGSATSRLIMRGELWLTVVSSSEAQLIGTLHVIDNLVAEADWDTQTSNLTVGWDDTTSDLTGNQDISVEIKSNNDAADQTAYPSFLTVREMPVT